jgi:hypothetical protein
VRVIEKQHLAPNQLNLTIGIEGGADKMLTIFSKKYSTELYKPTVLGPSTSLLWMASA